MNEDDMWRAAKAAKQFQSEHFALQRTAIKSLEATGDAGVAVLTKQLDNDDANIRWRAACALQRMGDAGIAALTMRLRDAVGPARCEAAAAFGRMGPTAAAVPASILATTHLKHRNADVRKRAAESLGIMGEAASAQAGALARCLGDDDGGVRWNAAKALRLMGETGAVTLAGLLGDRDPLIASTAAQALEKMGDLGMRTLSLEIRHGTQSDSWRRAADSLRRMGGSLRVAPDIVHLTDRDQSVRQRRARSISSRGPTSALHVAALVDGLAHEDTLTRNRHMAAVLQTGEVGAAALAGKLKDEHGFVRRRAVEHLVQLGADDASVHDRALSARTGDTNPWVRLRAVEATSRLGEKARALPATFTWPHRDHELDRHIPHVWSHHSQEPNSESPRKL